MDKETRNKIGTVLVWSGIAVEAFVALRTINDNSWTAYGINYSGFLIISIILLLVGGLWGMKQ
jgi:hypothetical protein